MSATGDGDRGFTLLETLTALALTALASAIAFPMLDKALTAAALAEARGELLADLSAARGHALRAAAPEVLTVAPDGAGYAWRGGQRLLPAPARLQPAGASVAYFPDGSSSGGSLTLTAGRRRAIVAIGVTGVAWVSGVAG